MRRMVLLAIFLLFSLSYSEENSISETQIAPTTSEQTDTLTGANKPAPRKDIIISVNTRQDSEYSNAVLQDKLNGYRRMHTAGVTMAVVGFPLTAIGLGCLIGGFVQNINEFTKNGNTSAGNGLIAFGQIAVAIGPEMGIAGVVLSIIGGKKKREYEERLNLRVGLTSMRLELLL